MATTVLSGAPIFCAYGRGQGKTHGAQSTRSNIAVRFIELCIAAGHHLVLSHISDDDRIAPGEFIEYVDHFSHRHDINGWIEFFLDHRFNFMLSCSP